MPSPSSRQHFSLFSELLLDGIECLPNGVLCDLVEVVVLPQDHRTSSTTTKTRSTNSTFSNFFSNDRVTKREHQFPVSRSSRYKTRLLFIAFDKIFDVVLKREKGSECFYEGHLIGKKHSTAATIALCGQLVGCSVLFTKNSVTRLGDLLDFGQLFKAFGSN